MALLKFIPNTPAKGSAGLALEDIPDEVRKDAEEVYETLKTNPGRMRVEFATLAELNTYITQLTAYCKLRPAGPIRFRKSPTRDLPPTAMDFRITDLATPNEQVTEEIRQATAAANATTVGLSDAAKAEAAKALPGKATNRK